VGDHAVSALNIARRVTPAHPHPIRAATVRESVSAARPAPCALPTALGGHAFRSVAFLDLVVYEGAPADLCDAA